MQGMRTGAPGASRKSSSVPSVWFQIHPALTYTLVAAPVAVAERPGADSVPRLRLARLGPAFREPSDAPIINSAHHGLCERRVAIRFPPCQPPTLSKLTVSAIVTCDFPCISDEPCTFCPGDGSNVVRLGERFMHALQKSRTFQQPPMIYRIFGAVFLLLSHHSLASY